jgi:predicted TIM-barrel fold metal-dependent hydrolase
MDRQGIQATWLLPSLGMSYEQELEHDPEASAMAFRAFNRWLEDDWGLNRRGRIYAAPYLAMGNVDMAVAEVEWALENNARIIVVRPSAVFTTAGWRSPGDPCFDSIWGPINEAGITVVVHIAETGGGDLERYVAHHANQINAPASPLQIATGHERAIETYLAALVCDRLFDRFPNLRVASVENGASFLPRLLTGLNRARFQRPGYFSEDPVDTFKRHVWVTPFWEDDLREVISILDPSRILFGSDWPHAEGMKEPLDYEKLVAELQDESAERLIMHENTSSLTCPPS